MERIHDLSYLWHGKSYKEGDADVPSLFSMSTESLVEAIEKCWKNILANDPSYFLVEVRIRPTNNIKVFLDGDNGISIEKCVAYNRILYKKVEESGMFPTGIFHWNYPRPGSTSL